MTPSSHTVPPTHSLEEALVSENRHAMVSTEGRRGEWEVLRKQLGQVSCCQFSLIIPAHQTLGISYHTTYHVTSSDVCQGHMTHVSTWLPGMSLLQCRLKTLKRAWYKTQPLTLTPREAPPRLTVVFSLLALLRQH